MQTLTKGFTIEQVCEVLGVKPSTVVQYMSKRKLTTDDTGRITAESLEDRILAQDPDRPYWRKVLKWFVDTGAPGVSDKTVKQMALALENRVKPRGHRRANETAKELGVSRERVRQVLLLARYGYQETIISGAYESSGDA